MPSSERDLTRRWRSCVGYRTAAVNRTTPDVSPPPARPTFSTEPSTDEIVRARVFSEPLVPVGGAPSQAQNEALVRAINAHAAGERSDAVAPFVTFLGEYPNSPWRASVLANLGTHYLEAGAISRALQAWEQAWLAARDATDRDARAVADFAVGEWLDVTMELGHVDALAARLAELEGRDVHGPAASKIGKAREALWVFENHHDLAVGSGVVALNAILRASAVGDYTMPRRLRDAHPTPAGTSLAELGTLAASVGLRMQMGYRSSGAPLPLPAVAHFGVEHYVAVLQQVGDRFLVHDIVLGQRWVSRDVLTSETTGFFLIPEGDLPEGWRPPTSAEATAVIGHCAPGGPDGETPGDCSGEGCVPCGGNCGGAGGGGRAQRWPGKRARRHARL